jgi:hypothetical protein
MPVVQDAQAGACAAVRAEVVREDHGHVGRKPVASCDPQRGVPHETNIVLLLGNNLPCCGLSGRKPGGGNAGFSPFLCVQTFWQNGKKALWSE